MVFDNTLSNSACQTDSQHITYCLIEGDYYVGDNLTYAYKNDSTPQDIIIPKTLGNYSVLYIGKYAFNFNRNLRKVNILASIIAINQGAFANCNKLEYINIPSSCKYLYANAVQCYNAGDESPGVLTVFFEINSSVQHIGRQLFSYKEFTHIYLCQQINSTFDEYVFDNTSVTIFSTSLFTINNIDTTLTYCCSPKSQCTHIHINPSNSYFNPNLLLISLLKA